MEHDDDAQLIRTTFARRHLQFAKDGNCDSAHYLLLFARDRLKMRKPLPPELADYLAEAFNDIALGVDPGIALHTRPGRKTGRPNETMRDFRIAERMLDLIESGKAASQEDAAAIVADELSAHGGPTDIKALKSIFRKHRGAAEMWRRRREQTRGEKSETFRP